MGWLAIILPLVIKFIEWLSKRSSLSTLQVRRINHFYALVEKSKPAACAMGCTAMGVLDTTPHAVEILSDDEW